jgi:hypothetical protein
VIAEIEHRQIVPGRRHSAAAVAIGRGNVLLKGVEIAQAGRARQRRHKPNLV